MDLATIIGLIGSIVIVVLVLILDGGTPTELFTAPAAILLTLGGATTATIMSSKMENVVQLPKYFQAAFFKKEFKFHEAIETIVKMSDKARREGLLALEEEAKKLEDPFLRKGIQLVVDGTDPAMVRAILETDVHHMEERHHEAIAFFAGAGGFAPTFGIIGTVMGLIGVLKELSNPDKLAKSIASAFLATLWGLLTANLIWMPIAAKLTANNGDEVAYRMMLVEGVVALQAGENPRLVKEKLNSFLPPKHRITEEEDKGGAAKKGTAKE